MSAHTVETTPQASTTSYPSSTEAQMNDPTCSHVARYATHKNATNPRRFSYLAVPPSSGLVDIYLQKIDTKRSGAMIRFPM